MAAIRGDGICSMPTRTMTTSDTVGSEAFSAWAAGYGVIRHEERTRTRASDMAERLVHRRLAPTTDAVFRVLAAADRIASAGMWLVVHMTYARAVYLDGRELDALGRRASELLEPGELANLHGRAQQ